MDVISKPWSAITAFFNAVVIDLGRKFRWSFTPPLLVYYAFGFSTITAVVGKFYVKDYLNLSAASIEDVGFWVGIPWIMKIPIGHLVDIMWRWKYIFVFIGASLMTASFMIMYFLLSHAAAMHSIMPAESWYLLSAALAPSGFVLQDVVADAMTVEAVPSKDDGGKVHSEVDEKSMHITMQTLGRVALFLGFMSASTVNIYIFDGVESINDQEKSVIYSSVFLVVLLSPFLSIIGVILGMIFKFYREQKLLQAGRTPSEVFDILNKVTLESGINWIILIGSVVFVTFVITVKLNDVPFGEEITFIGSLLIITFLISRLIKELKPEQAKMIVGTAIIIFVYRATPSSGAGAGWFEIDVLGFDQQFLSIISLLSGSLALVGLVLLRPLMVKKSIAEITIILSLVGGALSLPNIGLYYGIHEWSSAITGGIVDARFLAIFDTTLESPFGQVAMIPMLAWIARNAPNHLKATFFAVMASFTNLALSASNLTTKYMNEVFIISREVKDKVTNEITIAANYDELGTLLIVVALIIVFIPIIAVVVIQKSRLRTSQ